MEAGSACARIRGVGSKAYKAIRHRSQQGALWNLPTSKLSVRGFGVPWAVNKPNPTSLQSREEENDKPFEALES